MYSSSSISEPKIEEEYESMSEAWRLTFTGIFSEAAVLGLMSWAGEGLRLIDRVCNVSPTWRGMEEDILKLFRPG